MTWKKRLAGFAVIDAINFHKVAMKLHSAGVPLVPRILSRSIQFVFGPHIGINARIGDGTELAYGGMGIVIHSSARIGRNVVIGPHVTIGGRSHSNGAPIIEDDVKIGAGACLLGDIRIGRGAMIGANAVVTHDVPAGSVVAGIPAREIHARVAMRK